MGGEPTFVSATDIDAPEWNTDALGPTKRAYAGRLIRRLMDALVARRGAATRVWASSIPASSCRAGRCTAIGAPTASRSGATRPCSPPTTTPTTPRRTKPRASPAALAERLQVDPALVIPAYEDIHYYLWREHRLPANVLAEDAKLRDPLERARLARVFGQGLASAGRQRAAAAPRDATTARAAGSPANGSSAPARLFLIPGDSPIGLRLPLDSLPWADPEKIEPDVEPDPFAPREPLPPRQAFLHRRAADRAMAAASRGFRPVPQELPVIGRGEPERGAHRALRRAARRHAARVLPAAVRRRGLARR